MVVYKVFNYGLFKAAKINMYDENSYKCGKESFLNGKISSNIGI